MFTLFVLFAGILDYSAGFNGILFRIPGKSGSSPGVLANNDDLIQQAFVAQNCYRAKSGVAPLTLDPQISAYSQNWANQIASSGQFQHSGTRTYGENLFGAGYSFSDGGLPIRTWYTEYLDNDYNFQVNDMQNSGHFTQVVWNATLSVGFGVAQASNGWVYVVADYSPPGNFVGEYTANVFEPSDSNLGSCVPDSALQDFDPSLIQVL